MVSTCAAGSVGVALYSEDLLVQFAARTGERRAHHLADLGGSQR